MAVREREQQPRRRAAHDRRDQRDRGRVGPVQVVEQEREPARRGERARAARGRRGAARAAPPARRRAPPAPGTSPPRTASSALGRPARRAVRGEVRVERVDQQRVRHVALVLRAARAQHQRARRASRRRRGARAGSSCRSPPRRRSRPRRGGWCATASSSTATSSDRPTSGVPLAAGVRVSSRCGRDLTSLPLITSSSLGTFVVKRAAGPARPDLVDPVTVTVSLVPFGGQRDRGRGALDGAGHVQAGGAADVDLLAVRLALPAQHEPLA